MHFLDSDRSVPCLELLLDSTRRQLRTKNQDVQRVTPSESRGAEKQAEPVNDEESPVHDIPHQDCQVRVRSEKSEKARSVD